MIKTNQINQSYRTLQISKNIFYIVCSMFEIFDLERCIMNIIHLKWSDVIGQIYLSMWQ